MGVGAYSRLGANSRLGAYSNKYGKLKAVSSVLFAKKVQKCKNFSTKYLIGSFLMCPFVFRLPNASSKALRRTERCYGNFVVSDVKL